MVALCEDTSVTGVEFYVMERIAGVIPRARLPEGLGMSASDVRRLCLVLVNYLEWRCRRAVRL